MGAIEIFTNNLYFYITVVSLFLLFLVISYTSLDTKQADGVWLFFWGLTFEFLASWFGYTISEYQSKPHFDVLVFSELCLLLASLAFMSLAAFSMLMGKKDSKSFVWIFLVIAVVAVSYFVFVAPNGDMAESMRTVFPLTAFIIMALSFWAKSKYGFGYKLASLVCVIASIILIFKLLGMNDTVQDLWYIPATTYVLLSVAVLIIKSDTLNHSLKESRQRVENHTNQIENIIKSSPFPIIISRLSDDKIIIANNNAIKLFGIKSNELERYKLRDFFVDQENRRLLNEHLEKEKEIKDFEILVKTATGNTPFWLLTSANIIDYNHDITVYLAFQDITSRKNREAILKNQATRDPLTSLFNRRYFEEEVKQLANRSGPPFSILMLDVDKFKNVNDTYGHKVGDQVLIEMAGICEKALREQDIVARYGGEEFVIYLHDTNEEKSKAVAERVRETIAASKMDIGEGQTIGVTVSIGVATSRLSVNIDELVKMADAALYKAKNNGRNRTEVFEKEDIKDLDTIIVKKSSSLHPAFAKEENQEISLLDGIGANHITSGANEIKKEADNIINPKQDEK
ncbi:MAG: sensor domain-containing diguanylate cyclase [Lactobacillaceae bacterium]|jgi:diguanylate cyclase (GGDEF)-like protein/PAS domain S-box-containing protein|nr:sensor domain-containing diguanylate cyclase [Lactobacillaceae bacterium]